jgi:hypothetical protein
MDGSLISSSCSKVLCSSTIHGFCRFLVGLLKSMTFNSLTLVQKSHSILPHLKLKAKQLIWKMIRPHRIGKTSWSEISLIWTGRWNCYVWKEGSSWQPQI